MAGIAEVVERVQEVEQRRKEAGEQLAAASTETLSHDALIEEHLVHDVESAAMEGREVVGVDGGLLKREYQGIDIVMTRAVGAVFSFHSGGVEEVSYIPSKRPTPDIQDLNDPLDRRDFRLSSSILRVQKELEVVRRAVEQEPDMVLLDGSIVPQYTDRPAEGTHSRAFYDKVIETYREVFAEAADRDVLLAGVIEDSRSSVLGEMVAEESVVSSDVADVVRTTRDTAMLFHVLEEGQRSCVMKYSEEYEKHPTLQDIGEAGGDIYNMYLRTVERDVPVRIDFLADEDAVVTADAIASKVLPLCEYSKGYGIPSVIVEADQRAKLSEEDLERLETRFERLNVDMPGMRQMRRNNRPF